MNKCPYCGSDSGLYRTYTGVQYYDWDGQPMGYHADVPDNQRIYARCIRCDRRISMARVLREAEEKEDG